MGPIAAELTARELADVLLYGDGLLHRTAEQHALMELLRKLGGTGAEDWARQAPTCLFYDTGITVLRVDDLLATALDESIDDHHQRAVSRSSATSPYGSIHTGA